MFPTEGACETVEPVLLAWSGGKDSCLALQSLRASDRWRVVGLLTTVTEAYDRISMHGVRAELLREQADAIGLPLTTVAIPPASSNETYEERMGDALADLRATGILKVAFGDLYLREVREYRERMLGTVGMSALFPLWGLPTDELAHRFIAEGHRAVLTCIDTSQVASELAGREYDEALLGDLPAHADPCGENGEFHSFVYDGPMLSRPISIRRGERVLREGRFMYCDLLPVGNGDSPRSSSPASATG